MDYQTDHSSDYGTYLIAGAEEAAVEHEVLSLCCVISITLLPLGLCKAMPQAQYQPVLGVDILNADAKSYLLIAKDYGLIWINTFLSEHTMRYLVQYPREPGKLSKQISRRLTQTL